MNKQLMVILDALSFGVSPNDTYSPFFTIQAAAGGMYI